MDWFSATRIHCQLHGLPGTPDSVIDQMVSPTRYMNFSDQIEDSLWLQSQSAERRIPKLFASLEQLHKELPRDSREELRVRAAIRVNDTLCKRMELAENASELISRLDAKPDVDMLIQLRGGLN